MNIPQTGRLTPFRIYGNLYFVSIEPASSHLIATEKGLILWDSGYLQTLYLVQEFIWELGFAPRNIRYIIHSHGHYDHLGATKALLGIAQAKTFLGVQDIDYANGKLDLTWAKKLGHIYHETFEKLLNRMLPCSIRMQSVQVRRKSNVYPRPTIHREHSLSFSMFRRIDVFTVPKCMEESDSIPCPEVFLTFTVCLMIAGINSSPALND